MINNWQTFWINAFEKNAAIQKKLLLSNMMQVGAMRGHDLAARSRLLNMHYKLES